MKPWAILFALLMLTGCYQNAAPRTTPAPPPRGQAMLYLPGSPAPALVQYDVVGGQAIFEGDIMLGPVSLLAERYGRPRYHKGGNAHYLQTHSSHHLWPGGVIPYTFHQTIAERTRQVVAEAATELSSRTPLTVRPRLPTDTHWVEFTAEHSGCWSLLGRVSKPGGQQINLSGGCGSKSTVLHEVLHAAGVRHEHTRPDRDQYVTIVWSEVQDNHRHNFDITEGATVLTPYDYDSVMHYSARAFSKRGQSTIVPTRAGGDRIGQGDDLSAGDILGVQTLYAEEAKTIPGLTGIPGLTLPIPGVVGLPDLPWALPGVTPVQLPALPGVPTMPSVLTMPSVPAIPTWSQLPSLFP